MIPTGKCPKCEKIISNVKIESISASAGISEANWKAVAYCCPLCGTVLSVQIDPIAIESSILNALKKTQR